MSNLQTTINTAADKLTQAFLDKKAANEGLRELRKSLRQTLSEDLAYTDLEAKEKEMKKMAKDIREDLVEIKKNKEAIEMEQEEQKELDEFLEINERNFNTVKDNEITNLSRRLADEGLVAEIDYKKGELHLIVARA